MAQQTTEEISDRAENTAEFIRENISGWSVTVNTRQFNDKTVFIVYCDDDAEVNGYAKGSVINTVLTEVPALEVTSTMDDRMAVSFEFQNK